MGEDSEGMKNPECVRLKKIFPFGGLEIGETTP